MGERLLVIGGDAGGMAAASQARRLRGDLEIVALEKGSWTSYSACGIPYLIGGTVDGGVETLVARTPEEHRRRGIDVRMTSEAVEVDTAAGEVAVLDHHTGATERLAYDHLLLATGGEPIRPPLPGIDLPFVRGVQTLGDAEALLALADDGCRRIVVVGGGYIGLEMAEAYIERGCTATIVERLAQPLSLLDEDLASRVTEALRERGIDVLTETDVQSFEPGMVHTSGGDIQADLVVLGIGVRPRSHLAAEAGIELGVGGAVHVDDRQATTTERVWSAGDCAESTHRITGQQVHIALGTYANKAGRVAGINMAGGDVRTAPVVGTAITKLCSLEIGLTGLRRSQAADAGIDAIDVTIDTSTSAGYMPDAREMSVRMCAERGSGRLLGAQIVGGPGAAKRVDTVATALAAGMTVSNVADLDLAYAPPFSSVWDPVAVAAREAMKEV
ncbi:MAG: FAD-dependent oxidoreductase [Acidimicrobiia bacterium]|nr:FAD-dependent oxidoreductase [Acidimicrobiia bacterium]